MCMLPTEIRMQLKSLTHKTSTPIYFPSLLSGASIPLRQWCISPLFQIFPYFRKKFRLRGKFSQFYLFPKKFQFSSAKFFLSLTTNFEFSPYFRCFSTFPPISRKLLFPPTFQISFPNFVKFTCFLCVFCLPPSVTVMHICITQCTMAYWTPLP